jgi:hypothetical protein
LARYCSLRFRSGLVSRFLALSRTIAFAKLLDQLKPAGLNYRLLSVRAVGW